MAWRGALWRQPQTGRRLVAAYLRVLAHGWREQRATPVGVFAPLRAMIEPRLRALVADAIGVRAETLALETSLTEDLAMDSLDLLDVAMRAESEFGIAFPDRELPALRTYGDLVAATTALIVHQLRAQRADRERERVELRVGATESAALPRLLRVLDGTPYDHELLTDDVRSMSAGEPLEINTSPNATPAMLADLERALARAGVTRAKLRAGVPCAPDRQPPDDTHAERSTGSPPAGSIDERATPALPLVDRLQAEGETTVRHLASGAPGCETELRDRRSATNSFVDEFRSVMDSYLGGLEHQSATVSAAAGELRRLSDVRSAVDHFAIAPDDARKAYGAMADALLTCVPDAMGSRTRRPPRAMPGRGDDRNADGTTKRMGASA